jgi:3-dehydroquinate synthase
MRGIDFVQIPTTLLSMTDSSVGAKTGVDLKGIKNMVGCFAQPQAVFIDTVFLATLPQVEWKSGFAEVVKHGLIGDPLLLEELLDIKDISTAPWPRLLRASVQVKSTIVEQDPIELGLRKLLNFGHTVGHAVETYQLSIGQPLSHGACVAVGMLVEYSLAWSHTKAAEADVNLASATYLSRQFLALEEIFIKFYEIPRYEAAEVEAVWELMKYDKKNKKGEIFCAVPKDRPYTMRQISLKKEDFIDFYSMATYRYLKKA